MMAMFMADRQPTQPSSALPLTPCNAGSAAGYPCNNVDLAAFIPFADLGGGTQQANDIWGWTDPLSNREFAIMGRTDRTVFVEVTDPINPVYIGYLPTEGTGSSAWRDIKVYQHYALIVSELSGHGLQIFDLTKLLTATPPTTFTKDAHYGGFGNAHNVIVNEDTGYAYVAASNTCNNGLHMININQPLNPQPAGCVDTIQYIGDAQCVIYNGRDVQHIGKEICFATNRPNVTVNALAIIDVTNKGNPQLLSQTFYANGNFVHQNWLTEDHAYILLSDRLDEFNRDHSTRTRIFDLTDLDSVPAPAIYDGPTEAIDHNLYTKGHSLYAANYRAGLEITDLSNIATNNLTQIGNFDVYPADNISQTNGAWSNYPYFQSDIVVVSHIEQGLFILQPTLPPDFNLNTKDVAIDVCNTDSGQSYFSLDDIYGYTGNVTINVAGIPAGATGSFDNNSPTVPGGATLTVNNTSAALGNYLLTITATDGSITSQEYVRLSVRNNVGTPTLNTPTNGATDVSVEAPLSWTTTANATRYLVEVATDNAFTNIVYATTVNGTSHTTPPLNPVTTYYWRVTAQNGCSNGTSATFSFQTVALPECTYYNSTTSTSITDATSNGPENTTSTINVAGSGEIVDVNVTLRGTHTWMSDLVFTLRSPAGTNVTVMDAEVCLGNDNFDLTLDDEANDTFPCPPIGGGTYLPTQPLTPYDGQNGDGTWQLTITDQVVGDFGTLLEWGVEICTPSTAIPPNPDFSATPLTGLAPLQVSFTDLTANSPTSWLWNFGDGNTSTSQNPTHTYTTPGTYTVTLTANNGAGSNLITKTSYITVQDPANLSCIIYDPADLPQAIPATGTSGTTTSQLTVAGGTNSIADLNLLNLTGLHGRLSQITVNLTSPTGTNQQLLGANCGNDDNFNLSLDNNAASPPPCPPTDGGTYQPTGTGSLVAFNNEDSNGTWTLTIDDNSGGGGGDGTGSLTNWQLEICSFDLCSAPDDITSFNLTTSGPDLIIDWTPNGADEYEVWWTTTPYQLPGSDCSASPNCAVTTNNSYTHTGVVADTTNNYAYYVLGHNSCGQTSGVTIHRGEFGYNITPGN
ncbi:MAG TPA: choice-of-anchor B family protein [Anaerolineae bacterium]|nr:choice-of-anchor B family protein [Anaerolineae bacterium]